MKIRYSHVLLTFFAIFLVVLLFLPYIPFKASAQIPGPFGGSILVLFPCANGLKVTLGPPTAGEYMYVPGSFSYLNGPPSHSGQWLLGMSGPFFVCLVPCHVGLCPAGGGSTILFHGSSI